MSGNFGWTGNKQSTTATPTSSPGFSQARGAYQGFQTPAPGVKTVGTPPKSRHTPAPSVAIPLPILGIQTARHTLKSTADYVLIIKLDGTGSMGAWKDEIRKRLAMLYTLACEYLGTTSLQILFIVFGDTRCGDELYPLQVATFGQGPELEAMLRAFELEGGGGGNGGESSELAAYYVAECVDVSSARRVYDFTITDDAAFDDVRPDDVDRYLSTPFNPKYRDTKNVFMALLERMEVFTIFCETSYASQRNFAKWQRLIGDKRVAPLDNERRVVDVILGILAATVGKSQAFLTGLKSRQAGSKYAAINIQAVNRSIASVTPGGAPLQPMKLSPGALRASRLLTGGDPDPTK